MSAEDEATFRCATCGRFMYTATDHLRWNDDDGAWFATCLVGDVLTRRDGRIHRCTCGGWVYGAQPCGTCTDQRREVAA